MTLGWIILVSCLVCWGSIAALIVRALLRRDEGGSQ